MHPKRRVRTGVAHRRNLRPTREGRLAHRRGPLAGIFEGWREIRGSNSISSIPRSPIVRSFRPTKKRGFDCIAASVVERERRWREGLLSARSGFSWWELLAEMHIRFHYRCRRKVSRNLKTCDYVSFDRSNWISLLVCLQRIRRVA